MIVKKLGSESLSLLGYYLLTFRVCYPLGRHEQQRKKIVTRLTAAAKDDRRKGKRTLYSKKAEHFRQRPCTQTPQAAAACFHFAALQDILVIASIVQRDDVRLENRDWNY